MDIEECIKDRRSVRRYASKQVSWINISQILEAGTYAPCSGNIQNYYFIVVKNRKNRESITRACNDQLWMLEAPIFIAVCNDQEKIKKFYEEYHERYSIQNCAAAIENMLLMAHSLGLSACWVGSYDEIALQRILKLPDRVKVEAIITLGHSNQKPKELRKLSADKLTYFEEWGNTKRV